MKSECLIAEIDHIVISGIARGAGGFWHGPTAYVDLGAFYPAGMWVGILDHIDFWQQREERDYWKEDRKEDLQ